MDNKAFISNLAARTGCDATTVAKMTDCFAAILREQCSEGNRVAIPGFGTFEGVKHDEDISTDLVDGRRMLLPPSVEVRFSAGGMLRKHIKGKEGKK